MTKTKDRFDRLLRAMVTRQTLAVANAHKVLKAGIVMGKQTAKSLNIWAFPGHGTLLDGSIVLS